MTRTATVLALAAPLTLAATATLWARQAQASSSGTASPAAPPFFDPLEDRVARLERRLAELEAANQRLEEQLATLQPAFIAPKEGWRSFEFDGDTYYAIPLAKPEPQR